MPQPNKSLGELRDDAQESGAVEHAALLNFSQRVAVTASYQWLLADSDQLGKRGIVTEARESEQLLCEVR